MCCRVCFVCGAQLASKLKGVANRLESRAQRVEEEAERAKENLHLHFTTLEAALCRALREREAELAAQIDEAADDRCATLLQHRAEVCVRVRSCVCGRVR
jgi:hypothetical protein